MSKASRFCFDMLKQRQQMTGGEQHDGHCPLLFLNLKDNVEVNLKEGETLPGSFAYIAFLQLEFLLVLIPFLCCILNSYTKGRLE